MNIHICCYRLWWCRHTYVAYHVHIFCAQFVPYQRHIMYLHIYEKQQQQTTIMAIQLSRLHKIFTLNNAFIHIEFGIYMSSRLYYVRYVYHPTQNSIKSFKRFSYTHPKYFQKSTCSRVSIFRFILWAHLNV